MDVETFYSDRPCRQPSHNYNIAYMVSACIKQRYRESFILDNLVAVLYK